MSLSEASVVLYTSKGKYKVHPPIIEYEEEEILLFLDRLHLIDINNLNNKLVQNLLIEIINKPGLARYIDNDCISLFFQLLEFTNEINLYDLLQVIYIILIQSMNSTFEISTIDNKDNKKRIYDLCYHIFIDEIESLMEIYCAIIVQIINKFKETEIFQEENFIFTIINKLKFNQSMCFIEGILRNDIIENTQKLIARYIIKYFDTDNYLIYSCFCQLDTQEEIIDFYMLEDKWITDLYNSNKYITERCWNFVIQIVSIDVYTYGQRIIQILTNNPNIYNIGEYIYELLCIFSCYDTEHKFVDFFISIRSGTLIETLIEEATYADKRDIIINMGHLIDYIGSESFTINIIEQIFEIYQSDEDNDILLFASELLLKFIDIRKDLEESIRSCGIEHNIYIILEEIIPDMIELNPKLVELLYFFKP